MAGTITITTNITVNNGLDKNPFQPNTFSGTQTGADVHVKTITVTDAGWTALDKGSISSLGLGVIHNLSETAGDIVYVAFDGGTITTGEIPPKGWIPLWLKSDATIANVVVKAATGKTVLVKYMLWEA